MKITCHRSDCGIFDCGDRNLGSGLGNGGIDQGKVTLGGTTMSDGLSKKEGQQVKQEAEKYLKDKYGKDFDVDQIKYIWQTGTYTMKGHLKGEKDSRPVCILNPMFLHIFKFVRFGCWTAWQPILLNTVNRLR